MIFGLKKWDDRSTYWDQTNNPTEQVLKKDALRDSKRIKEIGAEYSIPENVINELIIAVSPWLESCGPTAAVNIVNSLSVDVYFKGPALHKVPGDEALTDFFNTPSNYPKFDRIRKEIDPDSILNNEIPQFYIVGIPEVFGLKCSFHWGRIWGLFIRIIKEGHGLMVCLRKPGHYIGIVAYDDETEEFIYRDPWAGNPWPERHRKKDGFNRRLNIEEFENIQPFYIQIGGK